jgi:hypothetical protein
MPDGSTQVFSPMSSTLIFGAEDAVLVDPPFTRAQIQNVGDWVERSGRRLAYISACRAKPCGRQVRGLVTQIRGMRLRPRDDLAFWLLG